MDSLLLGYIVLDEVEPVFLDQVQPEVNRGLNFATTVVGSQNQRYFFFQETHLGLALAGPIGRGRIFESMRAVYLTCLQRSILFWSTVGSWTST